MGYKFPFWFLQLTLFNCCRTSLFWLRHICHYSQRRHGNTLVIVTEGFPCGGRECFSSNSACRHTIVWRKAGWEKKRRAWCHRDAQQIQEACLTVGVGKKFSVETELECVSLKSHIAEASRTKRQDQKLGDDAEHCVRVCACTCCGVRCQKVLWLTYFSALSSQHWVWTHVATQSCVFFPPLLWLAIHWESKYHFILGINAPLFTVIMQFNFLPAHLIN